MGANAKPRPNREFFETGVEPEYFVSFAKTEPGPGGTVRVYCYAEKHANQFHLLYTAVCPAVELATMGRVILTASADAHNIQMWDSDTEH